MADGIDIENPGAEADELRTALSALGLTASKATGELAGQIIAKTSATISNLSPSKLPNWQSTIGRVLAGVGDGTFAYIGDSTTMGSGSAAPKTTIGSQWPNARRGSKAARLAQLLNKVGIPATESSWFGDGGSLSGSTTLAAIDDRVALGAGWAALSSSNTLGGRIIANSTTTNAISFTPTDQFTTATIWYIRNVGFGTFTVNVDGGATLATVDCNGSISNQKVVITVPLGTHTINLQRTGVGGSVQLHSMEVSRSDLPQIKIYNMGWAGSRSTQWSARNAITDPLWQIYNIAPATTIINLGINDARIGDNVVNYKTAMQFIIDKVRDASKGVNGSGQIPGDIILEVPTPYDVNTTPGGQATLNAFRAAVYELSAANGDLPVLDLYARWGGEGNISPSFTNKMYDNVHPNGIGYADIAFAEYQMLMGAVGQ